MSRERGILRHGTLFLAALLCLPPALRVGRDVWTSRRGATGRPGPGTAGADATAPGARAGTGTATGPAAPSPGTFEGAGTRYALVRGEVLPLADPSPSRSVAWVRVLDGDAAARDAQGLEDRNDRHDRKFEEDRKDLEDSAALADGALAGRVVGWLPWLSTAKVQTVLDPGFRAWFRSGRASAQAGGRATAQASGKVTGMVRGTGREIDARPLLEVQLSSGLDEVREGDPVFTRGRDGIYPEGVLIGHAIRLPGPGPDAGRWAILAAVSVRDLARVDLAADTWRGDAAEARRQDDKEKKRR